MILVTGANGFLGSYLTRLLVQRGCPVKILVRPNARLDLISDVLDKVSISYGDILDLPSLSLAFEGITHVYHTAAIVSFESKRKAFMLKTNIEGTANIVNLCLDHKVKKLVHVSSVAALGNTSDGSFITEKTPWDIKHTTGYGKSKYYGELEVYRGMAEGLDAVIVNPGMIFGGGYWDSGIGRLTDSVYRQLGFYTEGSNGVVDVRDVAKAMVLLMDSPITGEKFILVAENYTLKGLMVKLAQFLQVNPPALKAHKYLIYTYCFFEWAKSTLTGNEPLISMETSNYTLSHYAYSSRKLLDALPTFKYLSVETTLRETAEAYLASINQGKSFQVTHL